MIPGIPTGSNVTHYGNVQRSDGFKLPGPYVLSGEVPDVQHKDVQAICSAAFRGNIHSTLLPGLALTLSTVRLQAYVTFYVDDVGQHRFQEASSEDQLWQTEHLAQFVAWVESKGSTGVYSPAAPPWRPYALPTAQAFGPDPRPGEFQPEGHAG